MTEEKLMEANDLMHKINDVRHWVDRFEPKIESRASFFYGDPDDETKTAIKNIYERHEVEIKTEVTALFAEQLASLEKQLAAL